MLIKYNDFLINKTVNAPKTHVGVREFWEITPSKEKGNKDTFAESIQQFKCLNFSQKRISQKNIHKIIIF